MKTLKKNMEIEKEHEGKWQLQEAKSRLSLVVDLALHKGPQTITLRGKPAAVVLSVEEFRRLTVPRTRLSEFLRQSPLRGVDLDTTRSSETGRKVELG